MHIIDRIWRRLREGRTIYRAKVWLQHSSGHDVFVTIESKDPHVASAFANRLKKIFKEPPCSK